LDVIRVFLSLLLYIILVPAGGAENGGVSLENVRIKTQDERTRVVFDLSGSVGHRVFSLDQPFRTVIDLENTRSALNGTERSHQGGVVAGLRTGHRARNGLRVVLDLRNAVRTEFFALPPSDGRGDRLVVDLYGRTASAESAPAQPAKDVMSAAVVQKEAVVAIDPGHGGRDPGAIGPTGTLESEITLSVGERLAQLVDAEPNMRAVLTRSDDQYLSLRQRIEKARSYNADMFISIHADSFKKKSAKGSSVYVLSQSGASSEAARWLANRENAADLVGGATLDGVDKDIQGVVLNMLQEHTIGDSWRLAQSILGNLKEVGAVHKSTVERAGFVVLKSPDVPSVLVELAFLSNPREEAKLVTRLHQEKLAAAIMSGIRSYVRVRMPQLANTEPVTHVVKRGETLGGIARKYQVSMTALRSANGIRGDLLHTGAKLTIPGS